jgi:iron complex outermembrane receptor protein
LQLSARPSKRADLSKGILVRHGRVLPAIRITIAMLTLVAAPAAAQQNDQTPPPPPPTPLADSVFRLGEIVNVGAPAIDVPGIGAAVITRDETWTLERRSLDQAVNIVPGVSSTLDTNGRRNESNIFVRGFDRWQVPLMVDGVRIYLPADNRLDFARFLTSDVAAIQIQKGYASVLDGPRAMGGAIDLVTAKPTKRFEVEGGSSGGGRSGFDGSNGYLMAGSRQDRYFVQGSAAYAERNHWTLSDDYQPPLNSLQPGGARISSDSRDWHVNLKAGYTPTATNEYTLNFMKQSGDKGAPLNVYNNPPVPPNSFWRWPYWDVQNVSFLTNTQLTSTSYVKTKLYANSFKNGLNAYDDITYTTQSANGRFSSPYDDHAYGGGLEYGITPSKADTLKAAFYYRSDVHNEQQINRPTSPAFSTTEPNQEQSQRTWSVAAENTFHITITFDLVTGVSYDKYKITEAQEYNTTRGLFEYPKGGSDAANYQAAAIWRYSPAAQLHLSISDRARFPVIFELYSTRFGTATPNPDLGPERATNVEAGWAYNQRNRFRVAGTAFYSNVRDLIQTVVLPDTTTQTQNVGTGDFYGVEGSVEAQTSARLAGGANYTFLHRTITDALQPNLPPTGAPTHKAFLFLTWRPADRVTVTPNLEVAGDRWSDVNPPPAFPYLRTGAYRLLNLDAKYTLVRGFELAAGFTNLLDENYELVWGFPQPGRAFYLKTRAFF